MTELELLASSERRFGRLQAYEQVLHYASLAVPWVGCFSTGAGLYVGSLAVSALLRALWSHLVDEENKQRALVMAAEWEELEKLVG